MSYRQIVEKFITKERLASLFERWNERTDNPFVKAVGDENLEKYSRFCRSFESRLGNFLEGLAQSIVREKFEHLSEEDIKEIKREKKLKADLCFFKDNFWNIIELKAGGNIDSKKASAERRNLDALKLIISRRKQSPAKFYFATAYESDISPQNFSEDELLLGEKFWEFICEDELGYRFILNHFKEQMRLYRQAG